MKYNKLYHGGKTIAFGGFFSLNNLILAKALSGSEQLLPRVMSSSIPPSLSESV